MKGPYINPDDGELWIERGDVSWNQAQREAKLYLDEMGWSRGEGYVMRYGGIKTGVRVSDENEFAHGDDDGCADYQGIDYYDPLFVPCCRTIEAYHFYGVDR